MTPHVDSHEREISKQQYRGDCVTLVLLVRGVELTIVLLLGDYTVGETLGARSRAERLRIQDNV